jgi:hypothetical protein
MVPRRSTGYSAEIQMVDDNSDVHGATLQPRNDDGRLPTRRAILGLTTAGIVAAVTPVVAAATAVESGVVSKHGPADPVTGSLDSLLRQYGSEFGEVTKIG